MPLCIAAGPAFKTAGSPHDVTPSESIQFAPIILNGRTFTGPNSAARVRSGRILIPVAIVANALGDTVRVDMTARTVTVRRQTGVVSDFDAAQGRVRENESLVLVVSNVGAIIFSPSADELFLPVEIVSALFDVAIRFDAGRNVVLITRGLVSTEAGTQRKGRRMAEIYRADYEYNLNRYSSGGSQDLMLTAAGRLADGRFNFTSNSSSSPRHGLSLRNANFSLERPNGQRFVAGDFGHRGRSSIPIDDGPRRFGECSLWRHCRHRVRRPDVFGCPVERSRPRAAKYACRIGPRSISL